MARALACSGGFSRRLNSNHAARHFTIEYWSDDGWYVGRLKEIAGVVSEGETLSELEENIRDAYQLVTEDPPELRSTEIQTKETVFEGR